jgi:predicted GNAT family N-acyltransferase
MARLAEQDWRNFLVLEDAGAIAAVAHIRPDRLQAGDGGAVLLKGDLGHVGVRAELHGRGLGTILVQGCVEWMRRQGFHLSRLGGLMKFYRRFGYEPFIRRYLVIPAAPMDWLLKGTAWSEIRRLPPELAARVRPYHPVEDHAARFALLRRFYAGRSGALALPATPGPAPDTGTPDPDRLEFVYVEAGEVHGYLRASIRPPEAGDSARPCVDEFAVDLDFPEAVEALLKHFLVRIAPTDAPTEVATRFPYDERLFAALVRADIAFDVREMHQAADGNMIQVIDPEGIVAVLAATWTGRLRAAACVPWSGTLCFELPGNRIAGLRIAADGAVQPADGAAATEIVRATRAQFTQWLFGIAGFAEFTAVADRLPRPLRTTLGILFPRLPCASGPWG